MVGIDDGDHPGYRFAEIVTGDGRNKRRQWDEILLLSSFSASIPSIW